MDVCSFRVFEEFCISFSVKQNSIFYTIGTDYINRLLSSYYQLLDVGDKAGSRIRKANNEYMTQISVNSIDGLSIKRGK